MSQPLPCVRQVCPDVVATWSVEPLQCEKQALRKSMKLQPGGDTCLTLPPFGMAIAIELDENKLLTWRTVGFWRLIAEQKETEGVNHAKANSCNRSVSARSSGSLPVHIEVSNRIHY